MTANSKDQIILDALFTLIDAEFMLRMIGINPREAGAMTESCLRSAQDARDVIARLRTISI